ncbi:SanA/YdcF family protein [Desertihabitans brevis]|uniref:SanA/YdcF family protein n=1 Tax=Desertihabitans brevis TaxID=2268447 RepID=UPI0013144B53|nr:ElyC/SanA/YdcF family protein [Desertihabitans brevis]
MPGRTRLLTSVAGVGVLGWAAACAGVALGTHRWVHRPEDVPPREVAVVLGAQVREDGQPSGFLRGRLEVAAALVRSGTVQRVLVSGDDGSHGEARVMRRELVAAGVPAEAVTVDPHGYDTYDTCWRARHVYGLDRLVLVSQTYHLPRAVATARALGIDAVGVGDDSVRHHRRTWREGVAREQLALLKAGWDLLSRRPARSTGR